MSETLWKTETLELRAAIQLEHRTQALGTHTRSARELFDRWK